MKVKYNWFNVTADNIEEVEMDTGHMKDWTLIQIEGEEPEESKDDDPKAKGKAPAKGKPGAGSAMEEITDNRPREIQFAKVFAEEGG